MSGQVITTPRLKDKVIIDCFDDLAAAVKSHSSKVSITLLGTARIAYDAPHDEEDESLLALIKMNSELIFTASFNAGNFSVVIYRGGRSEAKSPYTDEVVITSNNPCQLNDIERLEIVQIVVKKLKAIDQGRAIGGKASKEQEELASIHEATLSRLEELSEKLIADNHHYREKLDLEQQDKLSALESKFEDRKKELHETYETLTADLSEKEEDFERKIKELDDKSNTHARRQIRKDIIGEIKKRQTEFKLTVGTNKLRWPVAIAMIGLILVFCVLAGFSIRDFYLAITSEDPRALWISGAKQLIYSFGVIASVLFYIRWQNRWFEQHSLAEFHLKQLELDMERASWIVETSLEWNDAKGNAIPTELLESLSRNLFSIQSEKAENLIHPADQLASAIMGTASMVKLKAGNAELEIDPRKLRKTRKEIEANH